MTNANELANTPIEVEVGSRTLKLRRLGLESLFAAMESLVISDKVGQMHKVAEGLSGPERIDYLRKTTSDLPTGAELQELSQSKMSTIAGIRHIVFEAAKKDQPDVTPEEITDLIDVENLEKFSAMISFLCGISDEPIGEDEEPSEKKAERVTHVKT